MKNFRGLLLSATLALALTSIAGATTITQTFALPGGSTVTSWPGTGSGATTFAVNKFNTSLGILQDIKFIVTFTTTVTGAATDANPGSGTDTYVFQGITSGTLGDPTFAIVLAPSTTVSQTFTGVHNGQSMTVASTPAVTTLSDTYLIDPSLFAGCAGTQQAGCLKLGNALTGGSTVDPLDYLNYEGLGTITLSGSAATFAAFSGPSYVNASGSGTATMAVTVLYDYTAAVTSGTPEPATMALFGSGLIGLGLLRRRIARKKQ